MIGNKRHNGGPSNKRRSMRRPLLNISAAKKLKGVRSSAIRENESRNGRSGNIQGRFWGRRRRITTLEMITFSLFDGSAEAR